MTRKSKTLEEVTTRKKGDPREDDSIELPKCPKCSKDPFTCTCGGFEDMKK